MPKVTFAQSKFSPIEVPNGANLMKALLAAGVPVASSCHGDGVCAKCRMRIVSGRANLLPPNETEAHLIDKFQLATDQRISCQVSVTGDLEISTGYW